jgi:hypothetical protein
MTRLLTGVLCFGLVVLPGVAKGGDPAVELKPGMLIVMGEKPQAGGSQWLAHAWDGKAKRPSLLFRKRSILCGDMHAFAVGRNGQQSYLNHNNYLIVQADKAGEDEKVIFRHKEYVRDLALDGDDNVYFSEASGAAADGHIYRLRMSPGDNTATAELFCDVRLRDMGLLGPDSGFWAGNFAFARDAKGVLDTNTLYLSSGNIEPAAIFRMTRKDGEWSKPKSVFLTKPPIMGLVFTNPREAYYVQGTNQVFRLTDLKRVEPALTLDVGQVWHVSVVPSPAEQPRDIIRKKE